jgi:putative hydrolase of the HAD superfamily
MQNLKVIALDADDTLWVNEPYFREAEDEFCALLEDYLPHHTVHQMLYKIEIQNLELYGYGVKSFMLSMIETLNEVTGGRASMVLVNKCIEIGKNQLQKPIELLDGVREVLHALQGKYKLVVATKGDLLDQERKLKKSGIQDYFHHVEIMSEKRVADYQKLLKHLDCNPDNFLMLGNSLKSDVLPVLDLGAYAGHIPYHTTWAHEHVDINLSHDHFFELEKISDILDKLK